VLLHAITVIVYQLNNLCVYIIANKSMESFISHTQNANKCYKSISLVNWSNWERLC